MTKQSSHLENTAQPQPKKWKKWLPIAMMALLGASSAGGFLYWKKSTQTEGNAKIAKLEAPKPPVFQALDPFVVNLQGDGLFLQVAFTLQLASQDDVDRLKQYLPQVRSRLLMLLAAKEGEELATTEGKQKLINEVIVSVKDPIAPGVPAIDIRNVFITSFVIQ